MGSIQLCQTPTRQHRVVNHSLHFVDGATSVHTQHAESYWNQVKTKFKRMKGVHEKRTSSCGGNVMEALLPQLWQVCVTILLSGTRFRLPRCIICWSTSQTVFSFCVLNQFFFKNHQVSKMCHLVSTAGQ